MPDGRPASRFWLRARSRLTANTAMQHIGGYTQQFALEVVSEAAARAGMPVDEALLTPIDLRLRTWYNPTLKAVIGFLPALIAMVMAMPAVTTTMALTREKEHGTLEQLIATPIRRSELLVGKLIPYVLSGMLAIVLCVIVAVYWFGSPFQGSFALYMVLAVVFLLASLAIALVLSVFVKTQQAAQLGAFLIFFFPGFFLSGIFYPLVSMQPLMKMEAYMVPTTHFVMIGRGLMLKGQGLEPLWPFALALLVMGLLFLGLAILLFQEKGSGPRLMLTRIWTLAVKELLQLWRDKLILLFVLLGPVSELALVAWATSGDIEHIPTAVVDRDRSAASRELVQALENTETFDADYYVADGGRGAGAGRCWHGPGGGLDPARL